MGEVTAAAARDLAGSGGFGALSADDRLTYATAVSPNPFSRGVVAAMPGWTPAVVRERMHAGDRHLELGCGVAGRMLSVLQAWPSATAVGVERSSDLAAEARRRATELGVADRFAVVCADTTTVALDGLFDLAFWSQFFFAEESRAGTLATAYRHLRPGGTLVAPLMGDAARAAADPQGSEARTLAIGRLVHGGWGVPDRSGPELVDEFRAAGFADVAIAPTGASVLTVVGTRP
jgi:cyclopropane fatty-acyl-phospholipid synthase-like methyltransferase